MSNYLKYYKLLIVEDDESCSAQFYSIFKDKCLELYIAKSGNEGLALFQKNNPDIILTSNKLQDLDSSQMKVLYKEVGTAKPIIVVSTLDEHRELVNAISLGVKNYLFKPIDRFEAEHTVEDLAQQLYIKEEYNKTNVILEQYKKAVDASAIVTKTDVNGNITYVNKLFEKISGYTMNDLVGKTHRILKHPDMDASVFRDLWRTITSKQTWHGVIKNKAKDGSSYTVSATIMPILDSQNNIVEYIAIRHDITELIKQQETILRQTTDSLTQLPNREKLLEAIEHAEYPNLAIININNFRDINDLYGFEVGDQVLVEVAGIISNYMQRSECQLFKLPSDEFAVLINTARDVYSFEEMVVKLINEFKSRIFHIGELAINISITIGVSHSKRNVLSNADIALQDARKLKKHYFIYNESSSSRDKTRENLNWHHTIKNAIKNDNIVPYFQPIYNLKTNKIEKYEALARLIDDNDELISPYFFLDIAKKYRLYEYITYIMVERTFEYFENKDYEFSINLSIEDILDEHMVAFIIKSIKNFSKPQNIVIEITESEGIENYVDVEMFLIEIKKYGCKVAIDDFGTGYLNFEYVIKLDVDYIKIDGSLIKNIAYSRESRIVVETIISFAKKLNIQTITEFVSTKESYDLMIELGADYVQGYYIGQPLEKIVES